MKNIFTYPNNSGTSYIDPNYIGDDTVGFQKRVKDLADGNYKPWLGFRPNEIPLRDSIQEVMENMSKYNHEDELEEGGNNTFYKFWEQPLINTTSEIFSEDVDYVDFKSLGGQVVTAITRTPVTPNPNAPADMLGFYDGQDYDYTGDNWPQFTSTPSNFRVERVGALGSVPDQDYFYPKISNQTIDSTSYITGEEYSIETIAVEIDVTNTLNNVQYTIKTPGDTDFTAIGLPENFVDATAVVTGNYIKIWTAGNTDWTLMGSPDNNNGTIFTATSAGGPLAGNGIASTLGFVGDTFTATGPGTGTGIVYQNSQMTDFTQIGAADNNIGTTFTATGPGTGTGTAETTGDSYIQPPGQFDAFTIWRSKNQLHYVKSNGQGTWTDYKLPSAWHGVTFDNNDWQYNPSFVQNFLLDDPGSSYVGDIQAVYENAGSLYGVGAGITDLTGPNMIVGYKYTIYSTDGSEDFTLMGAPNNTPGTTFTATAMGTQTSGNTLIQVYTNDKVLKLNGPGGPSATGNTPTTLTSPANDTTPFVPQLKGNATLTDETTWTELLWSAGTIFDIGSGITITQAQYDTIKSYRVGSLYDDGVPFPGSYDNIYDNYQYYGFCYANYEMSTGSVVSGTVGFPQYNATDYPFGAPGGGWDSIFAWNLTDQGAAAGSNRYKIRFQYSNTFLEKQQPPQDYIGQLTVGRVYEVEGTYGTTNPWAAVGATSVTAGSFVIGEEYVIETVGTTDFTLIGASNNNINHKFTATGVGAGTGTATESVFTATGIGPTPPVPGTESVSYASIYRPLLTPLKPTPGVPDPWDQQKTNNWWVGMTSEGQLTVTSGAVIKNRLAFILPTAYNGTMLSRTSGAFSGNITIAATEGKRYKMSTADTLLPGNYPYMQRTGEATYVANPKVVDTHFYLPGGTDAILTSTMTEFTSVDSDSNGYFEQAVVNHRQPGQFLENSDRAIVIETTPDTYTPPTPSPAEQQDIWDTDDEWTSDGETTPEKVWPHHVTPQSAVINYNSPTLVNNSQSGVKYTRSVGHTKWRLEVEYPPMSAEDFQKFHAIAQAAHGQSTPFLFKLQNKDGVSILWKDFESASSNTELRLLSPITPGDTTMFVEGFSSDQTDAFKRGEVFIDGENENGNLHTSLSQTDANVYGEAKIRTPWPFRSSGTVGDKIYKSPEHAIVTLASDNFEYQVDVNNYYFVSVAFDLDSWK